MAVLLVICYRSIYYLYPTHTLLSNRINKLTVTSIRMKISELCKMIEESIQSGRYPLDQQNEKQMAGFVQIINRSSSDDLGENDIKIEIRLKDLYVLNNYIQGIQHLPGIIEVDALDSFKMLSRRVGRIEKSNILFHS
jgi:hypothetical protein